MLLEIFFESRKPSQEPLEEPPEKPELAKNKPIEQKQHEVGRGYGQQVDHHLDPGLCIFSYIQQCVQGNFNEKGGCAGDGKYAENQPELEIAFNAPFFFKSFEHVS